MGRGVSSGGGQSSLGYLFGNRETGSNVQGAVQGAYIQVQRPNGGRTQNANVASPPTEKQILVGIHGNLANNYHRVDGQNCGNFIMDQPSTTIHVAPGGGSSLDYLFGGLGN